MTILRLSPITTFVATTDPARAHAFYADTLGFTQIRDEHTALVFSLYGALLRVVKVESFTAQPFTVLGWTVDDLVTEVLPLAQRGVVFERYPGLPQDENGVANFANGDRVVWFKDPDGNVLSVTQLG
jgi:catechol 2,3-dioxygenase-like lactoylglutathione lyase family enzyme